MARILVKTDARGWYADAGNPEGGKVRKTDGDQIFDNLLDAQQALAVLRKAHGEPAVNGDRAEPPRTQAPTGKILVGKTLEIRCEWKEGGKRCTNTRVIKPQDAFQVKYCVEHQKKNRQQRIAARRRAKSAERKAAREAAKA